ncbi:MAG: M20/M25/M40 family metallo-hydrolase, partial [Bacteroidota bacterium]|nr:M20/M25/M40 family metallo-hydrolase [Bacteroidota bacterium]
VTGWVRGPLSLKIESEDYKNSIFNVKAASFAFSPDKAFVKEQIIDAGNGLESDYKRLGKKVKNKIILCNIKLATEDTSLRNVSLRAKTQFAINNKAKAIIFIDERPNGAIYTGRLSFNGKPCPIPAICINGHDGEKLRSDIVAGKKITATLEMSNQNGIFKPRNIIGTIKGNSNPEEIVIVCGHLDSWDVGTGAIDNGMGSMEITDIARTFKALNLKTKRTIWFINFMGEEIGLLGSKAFVEDLKKKDILKNIRCVINLDITGNPKGFRTNREEMKNFIDSIGKQMNVIDSVFQNKNAVEMGTSTDHQYFMMEGITVIRPINNMKTPTDCYHSDCDTFDKIYKTDMVNETRFTSMLLYSIANANKLPEKLDVEENNKLLIKLGMKELIKK